MKPYLTNKHSGKFYRITQDFPNESLLRLKVGTNGKKRITFKNKVLAKKKKN